MREREHDDEAHLLLDIAGGDGVAFGVLYRRYLPVVVRWCWVQTGDRELAADLSAEVFADVLAPLASGVRVVSLFVCPIYAGDAQEAL